MLRQGPDVGARRADGLIIAGAEPRLLKPREIDTLDGKDVIAAWLTPAQIAAFSEVRRLRPQRRPRTQGHAVDPFTGLRRPGIPAFLSRSWSVSSGLRSRGRRGSHQSSSISGLRQSDRAIAEPATIAPNPPPLHAGQYGRVPPECWANETRARIECTQQRQDAAGVPGL
jgi:hypothetical protein